MLKIIRNDDVCAGTTLAEIDRFCQLCDRYKVVALHAITPVGTVRGLDCRWDNDRIKQEAGLAMFWNSPVAEYLRRRSDLIAVHGLRHTHRPTLREITSAAEMIDIAGLKATWFVPPFNEWDGDPPAGLQFSGRETPRLEEYLDAGTPLGEIAYLHSWRFEYGPFTWEQLDRCLRRITAR